MARELFVNPKTNQEVQSLIFKSKDLNPLDFKTKIFTYLESEVISCCEDLLEEERKRLFLMGSFSRGSGGVFSDLDFLFLGERNQAEKLNQKLRKHFSHYSLRQVSHVEELLKKVDEKGILSLFFLRPLNEESCVPQLNFKREEIEDFISKESSTRYKKFGDRPGKLSLHLKHSPGGGLDVLQARVLAQLQNRNLEQDFWKASAFIYKLRTFKYLESGSLNFQAAQAHLLTDAMGLSSEDLIKHLYQSMQTVFKAKFPHKKDLLDQIFETHDFSESEKKLFKEEFLAVAGLVSSPSYHVWVVNEHSLQVVHEVETFYQVYQKDFDFNQEDLKILVWAALFHDLKKGHTEPHSLLGAKAVQGFGEKIGWPVDQTELVSWLVREHLTLVKFAFKSDLFEVEFLKKLSARGCRGKKAILLFILSCADIKATNPSSWSGWKHKMLRTALDQVLGKETSYKEDLKKKLKGNSRSLKLLEFLTIKDFAFIPLEILEKDLLCSSQESFAFYQKDDRLWIRYHVENDRQGLALELLKALSYVGAYIHHAFFKTGEDGQVYNWICVETGVSLEAFQKRFLYFFENKNKSETTFSVKNFSRIRKTFSKKNYAVISFKGKDHSGALLNAVCTLSQAGLDIQWGHALTWGEDIEDVFGVNFSKEVDWSFLTDSVNA